MLKPYIKRSQFINVTTTSAANPVKVPIEADEVYVTQVQPAAAPAKFRRQRERDMVDFAAKNPTLAVLTAGILDPSYGRVNLDNPLTLGGALTNRPVTTAAGDTTHGDRNYNHNIGMKEVVEFFSASEGAIINVVIELVHYIPTDLISA